MSKNEGHIIAINKAIHSLNNKNNLSGVLPKLGLNIPIDNQLNLSLLNQNISIKPLIKSIDNDISKLQRI